MGLRALGNHYSLKVVLLLSIGLESDTRTLVRCVVLVAKG